MTIKLALLAIIEEHEEIDGTESLASLVDSVNSKSFIRQLARLIERDGQITIIPSRGGRGNKTIYRRNRNSPGYPRKVTR